MDLESTLLARIIIVAEREWERYKLVELGSWSELLCQANHARLLAYCRLRTCGRGAGARSWLWKITLNIAGGNHIVIAHTHHIWSWLEACLTGLIGLKWSVIQDLVWALRRAGASLGNHWIKDWGKLVVLGLLLWAKQTLSIETSLDAGLLVRLLETIHLLNLLTGWRIWRKILSDQMRSRWEKSTIICAAWGWINRWAQLRLCNI